MIVDLKNNKQLVKNFQDYFYQLEIEKYNQRPLLDANYYHRLNQWLQETHKCIYLPNKNQLFFKAERDYTWFLLKWG